MDEWGVIKFFSIQHKHVQFKENLRSDEKVFSWAGLGWNIAKNDQAFPIGVLEC